MYFNQDDFKAIPPNTLLKVYLKDVKGRVRDKRGRIQNYVYGFVSEKSNSQYLYLIPRSYDDRITHNVLDNSQFKTPDDSEFFVWYNDIEKYELVKPASLLID